MPYGISAMPKEIRHMRKGNRNTKTPQALGSKVMAKAAGLAMTKCSRRKRSLEFAQKKCLNELITIGEAITRKKVGPKKR